MHKNCKNASGYEIEIIAGDDGSPDKTGENYPIGNHNLEKINSK